MVAAFDNRHFAILLLAIGAATLGGALASQYWGGLQPCILCLYQRYPWAIVIALAAFAAALPGHALARPALALAALACVAGAAIAFFHVGVEQQWWRGTAECGGTIESGLSIEELREAILKAPVVRCDEVAWSLFGISMAGYNFLLSLATAMMAGLYLWTSRTRSGDHARP